MSDAPVEEIFELPYERQWKRPWMRPFLRSLCTVFDISSACREAGISRTTAYNWREWSPEFAAAWDECPAYARDFVERVLHSWITTGVPVKRTQTKTVTKTDEDGNLIETTTTVDATESAERSATLMIFYLKAHYAERYRFAERIESSGPDGAPIQVESITNIDREIAELRAELNRRAAAAGNPPVPVE